MTNIIAETKGNDTTVTTTCPECKEKYSFAVLTTQFVDWANGSLVQNAFPQLNEDDRERLITGICPKCWDEIFAENNYE